MILVGMDLVSTQGKMITKLMLGEGVLLLNHIILEIPKGVIIQKASAIRIPMALFRVTMGGTKVPVPAFNSITYRGRLKQPRTVRVVVPLVERIK